MRYIVWTFLFAALLVIVVSLNTPVPDKPHDCGVIGCKHDPENLRASPIDGPNVRPAGEPTPFEKTGKSEPVTHDLSGWEGYQAKQSR
jgi:hypothetical protein